MHNYNAVIIMWWDLIKWNGKPSPIRDTNNMIRQIKFHS